MKKVMKAVDASLLQISLPEFLEYYNKNIPASFPRASTMLLKKFKEGHVALFKNGDFWSLDQHRKKVIEWLSQNANIS